jgi:hypothetical protein
MSATQDLLPFPKHDGKPIPVARTKAPTMVTRPLAKPAKAVPADGRTATRQLPKIHPMGMPENMLQQDHSVPQSGRRAGAKFAQARFARSVELAGSCLLIVTFLAAALFV